jgi:hypothetical protein
MRNGTILTLFLISLLPIRSAVNMPRSGLPQAVQAPVLKWKAKAVTPGAARAAGTHPRGSPTWITMALEVIGGRLHRDSGWRQRPCSGACNLRRAPVAQPGGGRPARGMATWRSSPLTAMATCTLHPRRRPALVAAAHSWRRAALAGGVRPGRDGDLEIIVASTRSADQWFVFEHDSSYRGGEWPQHTPTWTPMATPPGATTKTSLPATWMAMWR